MGLHRAFALNIGHNAHLIEKEALKATKILLKAFQERFKHFQAIIEIYNRIAAFQANCSILVQNYPIIA